MMLIVLILIFMGFVCATDAEICLQTKSLCKNVIKKLKNTINNITKGE